MAKVTGVWKWRGKDVPVTMLSGQPYMEVATKIALAHEDGGFTEIGHDFLTIGGKDVVRVCIEMKGQRFYGSAQIKWGGKNADATDPIENAETSAKGRALSAAGYQINSIASAEDMERVGSVTIEAEQPRQIPQRPAQPKVQTKALPEAGAKRSDLLRAEAGKYGYGEGTAWQTLVVEATGRTRAQIVQTGLQEADYQAIEKRIGLIAKAAKAEAAKANGAAVKVDEQEPAA